MAISPEVRRRLDAQRNAQSPGVPSAPAPESAPPRVTPLIPGNAPQGRQTPAQVEATAYAQSMGSGRAGQQLRREKTPEAEALGMFRNRDMLNTIRRATNNTSDWTAGWGSYLSVLPTTDARDLSADIGTIKANIGFDRLSEMRQYESPTGGALGQVAIQELDALQSSIAALDQGLEPADLRRNLRTIEFRYANLGRIANGLKPFETQRQYFEAVQRQQGATPPRPVQNFIFDPSTGRVRPKRGDR